MPDSTALNLTTSGQSVIGSNFIGAVNGSENKLADGVGSGGGRVGLTRPDPTRDISKNLLPRPNPRVNEDLLTRPAERIITRE